jgi:hypothetical protein
MSKVDFKKTMSELYNPPRAFGVVEVPPMQFLMVDGDGNPNTAQAYQDAVAALYAVAYKIKFASKKALGFDYVVPPLEGLWWADDMAVFTAELDKERWRWTMMIMQPPQVTPALVEEAQAAARKAKPDLATALDAMRLETYAEGLAVQIMHVGSYADEAPVLHAMHHEFIPQQGYVMTGKHHEIYLGDPRRSAPEKLKTVLRQPVARAG